jgi:hypothetical protein
MLVLTLAVLVFEARSISAAIGASRVASRSSWKLSIAVIFGGQVIASNG